LKILVVQESDWLEMGVHQQHHLMERLSLRGHEVRAIDFEIRWNRKPRRNLYSKRRFFNNVSKTCEGANVKVVRPGILKLPLLDYISIALTHSMEIRRQMVEFKPDVVIGLGILNTFVALQLAKRLSIPFVYYLIDALHTLIPVRKLRFLGKVLESDTLSRCDVVCVINEELKRYAIEMGAQPKKVHVVRAGVDTERFNPDVDGYTMREKLGISRDDVVLFFMGWLYSFSGLKEVALTLAKVRDEYPDIKLLIVGEGDLYHELQQIKKDFSLQQLLLAGWQPYEKIPEYLAASDICLLPAHDNEVMRNIVPIKMYEYMACRKPVVSTKLLGILQEFGQNNGVVYANQPKEVLKKAIELCNDYGSIRGQGVKARAFVEKYSWDKITHEFENILKAVAQKVQRTRL
jgi:glycosyltransferase involved in cell wall biosynthesis